MFAYFAFAGLVTLSTVLGVGGSTVSGWLYCVSMLNVNASDAEFSDYSSHLYFSGRLGKSSFITSIAIDIDSNLSFI